MKKTKTKILSLLLATTLLIPSNVYAVTEINAEEQLQEIDATATKLILENIVFTGGALQADKNVEISELKMENPVLLAETSDSSYFIDVDEDLIDMTKTMWEYILCDDVVKEEETKEETKAEENDDNDEEAEEAIALYDFTGSMKREELVEIVDAIIKGNQTSDVVYTYSDIYDLDMKKWHKFTIPFINDMLPVDENRAMGVGQEVDMDYVRDILDRLIEHYYGKYDSIELIKIANVIKSDGFEYPYLIAAAIEGVVPSYIISLDDDIIPTALGIAVPIAAFCSYIQAPIWIESNIN